MSGNAWLDLENLAMGVSTPVTSQKVADHPSSQSRPSGGRSKHTSTGPRRPAGEEVQHTPKRSKRDPPAAEPAFECVFELDSIGPQDYEAFKKDPLMVCSEVCRSASQLLKEYKIEAASAQKEKEAALHRLTVLEPQLEEAREAREASEKGKRLVEEDRAKMSKKIQELMSQNRVLQDQNKVLRDQVARAKDDQAMAVTTEVKRVAGLARTAAIEQFRNACSQMAVFNAARGVQIDDKIINADHVVEDGEIVLPQKKDGEGKVIRERSVIFARPRQ